MVRTPVAVGMFALAAAYAHADVVGFTIYENASGGDVSGLLMTAELVDAGARIEFIFRNQSTTESVITAVYFEDTAGVNGKLLGGNVAGESAGVDFEDGATPHDPAQHPLWAGGDWNATGYAAGAASPSPQHGVNQFGGEWVAIGFEYGGGADFATIVDALTGPDPLFRIAMHIQSVGPEEFSVWGTSVPTPASAALLTFGGLVATRRRR